MPFYYETLLCNDTCTKIFYFVLNTKSLKITTVLKWISKLNCNFDVQEIFKICIKVAYDTAVQWLQFRILHRFLPVSNYLKNNNIKADDCCAFCKKESETIEHAFLFWKDVLLLWNTLSQNIFRTTDMRVYFNINKVMLGDLPLSKHNRVVNLFILWTKQFIFLCLMQKKYQ